MARFTVFSPHPALADIVEAIWDCDWPEAGSAGSFKVEVLPTVASTWCLHYRESVQISGALSRQRGNGLQSNPITVNPTGKIRTVILHFKPEAACRLMGGCMDELTDAGVDLMDVFSPTKMALLEETLAEAPDVAERARRAQAFLLRHVRDDKPDAAVQEAVFRLRRSPALSVHQLARDLGLSHRQLSRRFQARVGTSLKQFARVSRFGKVVAARRHGAGWADIAYTYGFTDQAHLVNDFKSLAHKSPDVFFRSAAAAEKRDLNETLAAVSSFSNTFVV